MKQCLKYLVAMVGLALSSSGFATTVAAKKDGVEVFKGPERGAEVVTTLKADQAVETVERKGMFWKVQLDGGQTGFVSVMAVKRQSGDNQGLAKAIRAAAKDGRAEREVDGARARSAVMGVRGLDENNVAAFAANTKPNMRMVYKMEDLVVPNKKLDELGERVSREVETRANRRGGDDY